MVAAPDRDGPAIKRHRLSQGRPRLSSSQLIVIVADLVLILPGVMHRPFLVKLLGSKGL